MQCASFHDMQSLLQVSSSFKAFCSASSDTLESSLVCRFASIRLAKTVFS